MAETHDNDPGPPPDDRHGALSWAPRQHLRWVVTALCFAALLAFLPVWGALAFAAWVAAMGRPLLGRFSHSSKTKGRVAAILTTALVLVIVLPLALVILSLSLSAAELGQNVLKAGDGAGAVKTLLTEGGDQKPLSSYLNTETIMPMVESHGKELLSAVNTIAGAAMNTALIMVVFVLATYTFLVDGPKIYAWLRERSPILSAPTDRLAAAFMETGHGLLIGTGLTAAVQGVAAGIGYAVVGIPSAFVLGFVTGVMSLVPAVGTGLVWGPIALGLFAMGRSGQAVGVVVVGLLVSTADNFLKPLFSRYGKLQLPSFVLFVTMVGGIMIFGGAGIVLGPLFARLAVEGLEILREQRLGLPKQPATPVGANEGM